MTLMDSALTGKDSRVVNETSELKPFPNARISTKRIRIQPKIISDFFLPIINGSRMPARKKMLHAQSKSSLISVVSVSMSFRVRYEKPIMQINISAIADFINAEYVRLVLLSRNH